MELVGTTFLTIFYRLFLDFDITRGGIKVSLVNESSLISFIFSYYVLSFITHKVTGSHFNPVITIAMFFKSDSGFNRTMGIFYILA